MRFMVLVYPEGSTLPPPDFAPPPEAVAAMMKFNEELTAAGVLVALDGLHPPAAGARIHYGDGAPKVAPGPFRGKEALGGYWTLDPRANSQDEAIDWMKRCPMHGKGVIEIRQVFEMEEFPEDVQKAARRHPGASSRRRWSASASGRGYHGVRDCAGRAVPPFHVVCEAPMKLYEFAPTRSIRVRWALQEIGIAFDAVSVNLMAGEHRHPEFLAINPAGKVPVLVDGDVTLTESIAIAVYLADKYPERRLLPDDLATRAQAMRWLLFTTTELEQPLWRMALHSVIYPEDKRLPADIALAREEFAEMAAVLDDHMVDREFVVGDSVTVADFVLAYTLDWAQMVGTLDGLPRLEGYMLRMYDRPRAPMRIKDAFASLEELMWRLSASAVIPK